MNAPLAPFHLLSTHHHPPTHSADATTTHTSATPHQLHSPTMELGRMDLSSVLHRDVQSTGAMASPRARPSQTRRSLAAAEGSRRGRCGAASGRGGAASVGVGQSEAR
eukprot:354423-Chlamydomonas_euryale.AAC.5